MTDSKWLGWDDLTTEARDTYEERWIESYMLETGDDDKFSAILQFEQWLNTSAQYEINFAGKEIE